MKTWDDAINICDGVIKSPKASSIKIVKLDKPKFANVAYEKLEKAFVNSDYDEHDKNICWNYAARKAIEYLQKGEKVIIYFGNFNGKSRRITGHVWLTHNGQVDQSNISKNYNGTLHANAFIELPNDIEEAKRKISSFVARWK